MASKKNNMNLDANNSKTSKNKKNLQQQDVIQNEDFNTQDIGNDVGNTTGASSGVSNSAVDSDMNLGNSNAQQQTDQGIGNQSGNNTQADDR